MVLSLSDVDWNSFPRPGWDRDGKVEEALQALASVDDTDPKDVCSRVLFALGNNHAGTYYPVVVAALPLKPRILQHPKARPFPRS
jgi:hypothetical protein